VRNALTEQLGELDAKIKLAEAKGRRLEELRQEAVRVNEALRGCAEKSDRVGVLTRKVTVALEQLTSFRSAFCATPTRRPRRAGRRRRGSSRSRRRRRRRCRSRRRCR
jgi:hypothetical protein